LANTLNLYRNGAVGFIDRLDGLLKSRIQLEVYTVAPGKIFYVLDNLIRRILETICARVAPENATALWQRQQSSFKSCEADDAVFDIVFDALIEFFRLA
jgi:hypothetical protein